MPLEPTRTDLPLVRRWGCVGNNGVSIGQFNVYRKGQGYYLTMQRTDGEESESMCHISGGDCSTLSEAYTKATSLLVDLLGASRAIGGSHCADLLVDTTTAGGPMRPLACFEAAPGGATETRHPDFDQLLSDPEAPRHPEEEDKITLLPGLPRILVPSARELIESQTGPDYELLVQFVAQCNNGLSRREIEVGLRQMLGPQAIEELFVEKRILRVTPTSITIHGRTIPILESDPILLGALLAYLGAFRIGMRRSFGGPEGIARMRAEEVARGHSGDEFDAFLLNEARRRLTQYEDKARNEAAKADTAGTQSRSRSGCLSALAVFVMLALMTAVLLAFPR